MIDDFKAIIGKRGFARPTLFRVEFIDVPALLNNIQGTNEIIRDLHFFAESAEFPGTQILTQEIRYYDMPAKFAYGKAHDELNITFRLDRDFQVKRLFDAWVNIIYDRQTGNIEYKRNYSGGIQIYQIMENGFSSYAIELEEVFPTQLGQVSLGWDQTGSYSRFPVTLTFKRMKVIANKRIFQQSVTNRPNNVFGNERIISGNLNTSKTQLQSILNKDQSLFRQIRVDNQSRLNDLFGGFNFL